MTNLFLKARHWQLFIVMCGIPFIAMIFITMSMLAAMIGNLPKEPPQDPSFVFEAMKPALVPMIVIAGINTALLYSWYWSIVFGLRKFIPAELHKPATWFKICLLVPLICMGAAGWIMTGLVSAVMADPVAGLNSFGPFFVLIFPLNFLNIAATFYVMYFVASTIRTAELKRELQFGEWVVDLLCIWFFIVGVWILQPKINKIVSSGSASQAG